MRSFQHIDPALRVFGGSDCLKFLAREIERAGCHRAVVVCGRTFAGSRQLDLLRSALGERCVGVYGGVRVHSPIPAVFEAADELQRLNADAVVVVGGGSAIVTARAASIVLAEGRDIAVLATSVDGKGNLSSPRLGAAKIAQFVVPTTPTTAIVKVGSAVLDPETGERRALFDPKTRAQAVFVVPEFLEAVPSAAIIGASLNTLVLAIEGLSSRTGDPFSDALLMHAARMSVENLDDPTALADAGVRCALVFAAIMCGKGTDQTGAGMALALGHAIGTHYGLDNGVANAMVLPAVMRFNGDVARAGCEKLAAALNLPVAQGDALLASLIDRFARLFERLDIPCRLRDAGVPKDALPALASSVMGDWFLRNNTRPVQAAAQVEAVLTEVW